MNKNKLLQHDKFSIKNKKNKGVVYDLKDAKTKLLIIYLVKISLKFKMF